MERNFLVSLYIRLLKASSELLQVNVSRLKIMISVWNVFRCIASLVSSSSKPSLILLLCTLFLMTNSSQACPYPLDLWLYATYFYVVLLIYIMDAME